MDKRLELEGWGEGGLSLVAQVLLLRPLLGIHLSGGSLFPGDGDRVRQHCMRPPPKSKWPLSSFPKAGFMCTVHTHWELVQMLHFISTNWIRQAQALTDLPWTVGLAVVFRSSDFMVDSLSWHGRYSFCSIYLGMKPFQTKQAKGPVVDVWKPTWTQWNSGTWV